MAVKFYNIQNLKKFIVPRFFRRIRTRNALWYRAQVMIKRPTDIDHARANFWQIQKTFFSSFDDENSLNCDRNIATEFVCLMMIWHVNEKG